MQKQELYSVIEKVASCMTTLAANDFHEYCPVSNIDIGKWEWPQGVGRYALFRYYKLSNNQEILKWLVSWYDRHIKAGLPPKNINTAAPMLTMSYLYEEIGDKKYLPYIEEWSESIFSQFARTEEAGLQHSGTGVNDLQGQLWDDTLVMTCLFLGKAGSLLGNKKYLVECERQFLLHTKYLCDHETGLWFHGWTFEGRHNFGKVLWGRGNGWISFAIADMLELDGISESVKLFLQETLYSQVRALKKYQDQGGMWRTIGFVIIQIQNNSRDRF